jgi:DNA-binding CsgD family transcriptional regulator
MQKRSPPTVRETETPHELLQGWVMALRVYAEKAIAASPNMSKKDKEDRLDKVDEMSRAVHGLLRIVGKDPWAAMYLRKLLLAGFDIGVFTEGPIQKKQQTQPARAARHGPGSALINAEIVKLLALGRTQGQIAQALGLNKNNIKGRINRMRLGGIIPAKK